MNYREFRRGLNQAIHSDDVESVRKIINNYSNLPFNKPEECSGVNLKFLVQSILMCYAHCENEQMCQILIEFFKKSCFSCNSKNKEFYGLDRQLVLAVDKGNLKLMDLLLKNGVNLNGGRWKDFDFVASRAFNRKNIGIRKEILKLLLENGLDVCLKNRNGQNLLHKFADDFLKKFDADAVEISEILVNYGVSLLDVDLRGWKPVHSVLANKNFRLYKSLMRNHSNDLNADEVIMTAELYLDAACSPDINQIIALKGRTILHTSSSLNDFEILNAALGRDADVNLLDSDGKTAFELLNPEKKRYGICHGVMIKHFAKLNFDGKVKVSEKNMKLLNENYKAREFYDGCTKELELMSHARFYGFYSYYNVLKTSKKNFKKLAKLVRNVEFADNFLKDFDQFRYYLYDLWWIFCEAVIVKNSSVVVESSLMKIFGNYLPAIVIAKLADNLTVNDLPLN